MKVNPNLASETLTTYLILFNVLAGLVWFLLDTLDDFKKISFIIIIFNLISSLLIKYMKQDSEKIIERQEKWSMK